MERSLYGHGTSTIRTWVEHSTMMDPPLCYDGPSTVRWWIDPYAKKKEGVCIVDFQHARMDRLSHPSASASRTAPCSSTTITATRSLAFFFMRSVFSYRVCELRSCLRKCTLHKGVIFDPPSHTSERFVPRAGAWLFAPRIPLLRAAFRQAYGPTAPHAIGIPAHFCNKRGGSKTTP